MTDERRNTIVVVRQTALTYGGDEVETLYGPFLPHVGGACTGFIAQLEYEVEQSDRLKHAYHEVVDVFIDPAESDCAVQPTR